MNSILKNISKTIDAIGLNYKTDEEGEAILFSMGGSVAEVQTIIRIQADNVITTISYLSVNIPEKSFSRILDMINEINKNSLISTLYLDKEEKKIAVQSFMIVNEEMEFDGDSFTTYMSSTISRVNNYAEDILKIAYGSDDSTFAQQILRKQIEEAVDDDIIS